MSWLASDNVHDFFCGGFCAMGASLYHYRAMHLDKWEGMDHVDNGGNSNFVTTVIVDEIKKKIEDLHFQIDTLI